MRFVGTVQGVAVDAVGASSRVECVPEDSFPAIHLLDVTWTGAGAEQLEHMSIRLVERPVPGDTTDELFDKIFLLMGTLVPLLPEDVRDALPPEVRERPPEEAVRFETPRGAVVSSSPGLRRVLVNDIPVVDDRAAAEGRAASEGVLSDGEFACPG